MYALIAAVKNIEDQNQIILNVDKY